MVCEAVELFPHASAAVHVRVTLYEPAQSPGVDSSMKVKVIAAVQLSVADAIANTGVDGQLMVVADGNGSITGATLS